MSEPARLVDYSVLLHVLAGGLGNVADNVIACLARADRQSLGLACKSLQDVVAARWRRLHFDMVGLPVAEVLRSKLLPKLRGVEELRVEGLDDLDAVQNFYRLLLALKHNGARIKVIEVGWWRAGAVAAQRLPPRRSARLAGQQPEQPHGWVLTADSLQQLQPFSHLERLSVHLSDEVDAAVLQPLLRAPALKTVKLANCNLVTGISLDLSACSQLDELDLAVSMFSICPMDITALQGLQPASGLRKLILDGFVGHTQWLQHISRSLPHLETLHLVACQLSETAVGASQHELHQQPSFPSLKELRLHGVFSDASSVLLALRHLVGATTRLQRLVLDFLGRSANILGALPLDSPGLAHLKKLEIRQGHAPRDVAVGLLGQLARNQRRLQKLAFVAYGPVASSDQATTQDLQAFLDAAPPGLKELRLRGFARVQPALLALPEATAAGLHLDIRA